MLRQMAADKSFNLFAAFQDCRIEFGFTGFDPSDQVVQKIKRVTQGGGRRFGDKHAITGKVKNVPALNLLKAYPKSIPRGLEGFYPFLARLQYGLPFLFAGKFHFFKGLQIVGGE